MPKVIADITMSLDGFVTGECADEQHGLGDAPEIHTWVMQQDAVDAEILEGATAASGAVVMGRRLFDIVNAPKGWNEDMGYGADQTATPPFFVVTHSPPRDVRLERDLGMRFAECAESRRQKAVDGSNAGSDAQSARFDAHSRLRGIEERVEIANNAAGLTVQKLSRCGKADIAPVPDQQGTSDLLLQAFNLFAECGLRDMQQTRRTAEV